jgi:hypothetical protein
VDHTCAGDDNLLNIKFSLDDENNSQNNDGSRKFNAGKEIQRIRHSIAKNAKIRNNIRITGGQSRSRVSYLSMNNKMKFSYR